MEGKELFDESLIVDTGGGVADVFIWLQDANVPAPPLDKPPSPATLRIKNLRYDPHALAMTTSQTLLVVNDDPVVTSPIFPTQTNPPTNMVTPGNSKHALQFHRAERLPIRVTATVHPWLKASLLVRDNPYFAITGEDGRFEIKNLPPGKWTFQFWHESAGYLKHKTGWPKGRLGVTIDEGVSDIGKIDVTYEDFDLSRPAEPDLKPAAPVGSAARRIPRSATLSRTRSIAFTSACPPIHRRKRSWEFPIRKSSS